MGEKGKKSLVDYVERLPEPRNPHGLGNLLVNSVVNGHYNGNSEVQYSGLSTHYSKEQIGRIIESVISDERAWEHGERILFYRKNLAEQLRSRLYEILVRTERQGAEKVFPAVIKKKPVQSGKRATFENLKVTFDMVKQKFGDKAYIILAQELQGCYERVRNSGRHEVNSEYNEIVDTLAEKIKLN